MCARRNNKVNNRIQSEVNRLANQMAALRLNSGGPRQAVGARKRARRRRNRARNRVNRRMNLGAMNVPGGFGSRQPMSFRIEPMSNGDIMLHNEELWRGIQSGVNSMVFCPGASQLSRLDAIANLYEQYALKSCAIEYRTASGTTATGQIIAGIDYNAQTLQTSASTISNLMPREVVPVWENFCLTVDPGRAMKQRWLFTGNKDPGNANAFALQLVSPSANPGTIWVKYSIHFTSPSQSAVSNVSAVATVTQKLVGSPSKTGLSGTPDLSATTLSGDVSFDQPTVTQGAGHSVVSRLGVNGLNPGDDFGLNVSTAGLNTDDVTVTFKDENGNALPPGSVVPVQPGQLVGGFWSSAWTLLVAVAKLVVEVAALVGTNGSQTDQPGEQVITFAAGTASAPPDVPPVPSTFDSCPVVFAGKTGSGGILAGGTFARISTNNTSKTQTTTTLGPLWNVSAGTADNTITINNTLPIGSVYQITMAVVDVAGDTAGCPNAVGWNNFVNCELVTSVNSGTNCIVATGSSGVAANCSFTLDSSQMPTNGFVLLTLCQIQ